MLFFKKFIKSMPDAGVEDVIKYLDLYIHIFHHKPLSHSGEMNLQTRISAKDDQGPVFIISCSTVSFLFGIGVSRKTDGKVTKQIRRQPNKCSIVAVR